MIGCVGMVEYHQAGRLTIIIIIIIIIVIIIYDVG